MLGSDCLVQVSNWSFQHQEACVCLQLELYEKVMRLNSTGTLLAIKHAARCVLPCLPSHRPGPRRLPSAHLVMLVWHGTSQGAFACRAMKKNDGPLRGSIVTVSSVGGLTGGFAPIQYTVRYLPCYLMPVLQQRLTAAVQPACCRAGAFQQHWTLHVSQGLLPPACRCPNLLCAA